MALLPAENLLDGTKTPATTTSEMKSALGTQRHFLADLLGTDSTDKAAARSALGAAPVVSAVLTKNVAGNADIVLLPIEAINDMLVFTGALTANIAAVVPNTAKSWKVWNRTSGDFSLTLKTAAGVGVTVAQGKKRDMWCDGADVLAGLTDFSDMPAASVIAKRHCVQFGPLTVPAANQPAQPDLVPQSQIGNALAVGITLKCSVAPTLFSAAAGFNADGSQNDINWLATIDIPVPGLPANTAGIVVWVEPALRKAGFYSVPDGDQPGGAIPITPANTLTFDYLGMKNYLATGGSAAATTKLVVVEVDTDATKVIDIRVRAYKRYFEGNWNTPLPPVSTGLVQWSNIGTKNKRVAVLQFECIDPDIGFAFGDRVTGAMVSSSGSLVVPPIRILKNRVLTSSGDSGSWQMVRGDGSTRDAMAPAKWKWRYIDKGEF